MVFALAVMFCMVAVRDASAAPVLTTVGPPFATGDRPGSVAFSPGGTLLATPNQDDDSVSVFAVAAGGVLTPVGSPTTTGIGPISAAFSPVDPLLATANVGGTSVSVFSVSSSGVLTPVGSPIPAGGPPESVAFSPGGRLLATANGESNSVSVFSVTAGGVLTPVGSPTPTGDAPLSVAFSPDGGLLATANALGKSVSVFSVSASGVLAPVGSPTATSGRPRSVAFSPGGGLLAAANAGSVSVFSVSAGGVLTPVGLPTPTSGVPVSLVFSPSGDLLATADQGDDFVSVFSVSAGGALTRVGAPAKTGRAPRSVAFDPGGGLLAIANQHGHSVSMFSVSERGVLVPVGAPAPTASFPISVAFSPIGGHLATANYYGNSVSLFSVSAGGALTAVASPPATVSQPASVAFGPRGDLLATANVGWNGSVSVFSVSAAGALTAVGSPTATDGSPWSVAFSPDGALLATDGTTSVSVFSVSASGVLTPVGSPTSTALFPRSVAFSPDGSLLATVTLGDDSVSVFAVSSSGVLTRVGSPTPTGARPESVAFSPDGALLATANWIGDSVSVFSVSMGGVLTPVGLSTPTGDGPRSVAFSPKGGLLATANERGNSMSLFLVSTGGVLTPVGSPTPTGTSPWSVAFSPDGSLLATANANSDSVSVYSLAAPTLDTWITSSGPPAVTVATTATFAFDANYPATFECRLDTGAFAPCVTPKSYAGLADGTHTFAVRAKDLVGHVADAPASRSWTIDLSPPVAVSLAQPGDGARNLRGTASFSWSPTTDNATGVDRYELWIDGTLSRTVLPLSCGAVCSAPPVVALADGPHSWQVRAVDGLGNVAASTTRTFTVDGAPPAVFTLAGPTDDAATTSRRPTLSWESAEDAGIGLADYDIVVDQHVAATGLVASATSFTPTSDLGEGVHRWSVIARDRNANERISGERSFTVDATSPVAAFTAAPNPALAGRTVTFDAAGSRDGGSGIVRYEWDLDGDGSFERDTASTSSIAHAYNEPATFAVQLRVTDRAGLRDVVRINQRITAAPGPGRQLGISINDGARYTAKPQVTIRAVWPSFASQMLISNDGGFKAPRASALRADTQWTLDSSGAERLPKIVYVRFMRGLTVSETYTDDIILDELAPVLRSARVTPSKGGGVPLVHLRARDRGLAGVASVQVTNDRRRKAKFRAYHATVKLTKRPGERRVNPRKKIYVRVRDRAGNVSAWRIAQRSRRSTTG